MTFRNAPGAALLSLCAAILLAAPAHAGKYYENHKAGDFSKVAAARSFALERVVTSERKAQSRGDVDSTQGLLPGTYTAALENQDGTLYFGAGRSYFVKYGNRGGYLLRGGGFWLPKAEGAATKLFYVVDTRNTVSVPNLEEAMAGQAVPQKTPSLGLIQNLIVQAQDGHLILVPTESGFTQTLAAELKALDATAPQPAP